ncbi:MAG: DUF2189 domain-containing protein [Alphaproteobacteria bacterium]
MTTDALSAGTRLPQIREIGFDEPWNWLAAGWRDLLRSPGVSLAYGALYAIAGCVLTYVLITLGAWYVILPLAAGFLLLGPLLAVGLYEASRRHEAGEPVTLGVALDAWRRNKAPLFTLGVLLMAAVLLWIYAAMFLFAMFYGGVGISIDAFFADTFFSFRTIWFLLIGVGVGAVIATVVFSMSAVAFPMIVDRRETSGITAVLTSVKAVRRNWWPMMLWAGLIVVFSLAGLVVIYAGLIVTLPLIGHASYHAYRGLVMPEGPRAL